METYDTYCLLPAEAELSELLDQIFVFTNVVYQTLTEVDVPLASGSEAAVVFNHLEAGGYGLRFDKTNIPRTKGGWLYRLGDSSIVIGVSGDASVSPEEFKRALKEIVPDGIFCTPGDQPPPESRAEFLKMTANPWE